MSDTTSTLQVPSHRKTESGPLKRIAAGFAGGAIAIGLLALIGKLSGTPLLIAPFGASSVLLFAAPESQFAQPRNLVGGHLLSAAIGLGVFLLAGSGVWQMALGVGLAIAAMQITRTVHPPAGADPLVIMLAGTASLRFLIAPLVPGVLVLLVVALVFNNVVHRPRWPQRW
jgi:CBS-domain-containing membrane protein